MTAFTSATVAESETGAPEGWTRAPLGSIASPRKGKKPANLNEQQWAGSVPYIDIEAFELMNIRRFADFETSVLVDKGSVLVVWDGARCGLVGKAPLRGALGSTIAELQFFEINADYLRHFLDSCFHSINSNNRGSGIPHVEPQLFWSLQVPVAPLAEQKRIVEKMEQLLARVNAARERVSGVPVILKRFRQAVLAAGYSGRLTADWRERHYERPPKFPEINARNENEAEGYELPQTWRETSVGLACAAIVDCPHSTPKWTTSGVICLRTTNFRVGSLDLSDVRYVSESTYRERTERLKPHEADVLYSREGGILGLACLIPPATRLCLGQRMMLMRPNEQILNAVFLMHALNCPQTNQRVRQLTGGSASPHLNVQEIKRFPIPIPPLAEQFEIVRRVGALFKLADTIEKRVAAAAKRIERLTQAILAKGFRGELVQTEAELARLEGRSYESASTLLARIRDARDQVRETAKRRRVKYAG